MWVDLATDCHGTGLFGVSLIGGFSPKLLNLANQYATDLRSPDPFSPSMRAKETARRNEIAKRIKELDLTRVREAQIAEEARQLEWQARWEQYRAERIRFHMRPSQMGSVAGSETSHRMSRLRGLLKALGRNRVTSQDPDTGAVLPLHSVRPHDTPAASD